MAKRFTENAQKIILIAQEEAKRLNHDYVGTEHILLGLSAIEGTVSNKILTGLGVTFRKVRLEIEKMVGIGDTIMLLGEIPFTPRAKKVLEFSVEESQMLGTDHIGTEHILLGLIREEEGMASRILENLGLNLDAVRDAQALNCGEVALQLKVNLGVGVYVALSVSKANDDAGVRISRVERVPVNVAVVLRDVNDKHGRGGKELAVSVVELLDAVGHLKVRSSRSRPRHARHALAFRLFV